MNHLHICSRRFIRGTLKPVVLHDLSPFATFPGGSGSENGRLSMAILKEHSIGGFLQWGVPKMVGLEWKILLKWMIWGTPI
jgi:hypothetical protein